MNENPQGETDHGEVGNGRATKDVLPVVAANLRRLRTRNSRIEERLMRAAYQFCDRSQVQTAKLLGVSRNIVRARLMQYGDIAGTPRGAQALAGARALSSQHALSGNSG